MILGGNLHSVKVKYKKIHTQLQLDLISCITYMNYIGDIIELQWTKLTQDSFGWFTLECNVKNKFLTSNGYENPIVEGM